MTICVVDARRDRRAPGGHVYEIGVAADSKLKSRSSVRSWRHFVSAAIVSPLALLYVHLLLKEHGKMKVDGASHRPGAFMSAEGRTPHAKAIDRASILSAYSLIDGEDWTQINIPSLFGPPNATRGKGLIVVPGHGDDPTRREILRNNTRYIPTDKFDCVVFHYSDVRLAEDLRGLIALDLEGCRVVHKKGSWVEFQYLIKPNLVEEAGYTSVTVMLDDVLIAPPNFIVDGDDVDNQGGGMLDAMSDVLRRYNLSSVSPNVYGSDKYQMTAALTLDESTDPPKLAVKRHRRGFRHISINEVQLVMLDAASHSGWRCYHSLLDPTSNPIGWGPDLCYGSMCNATLGLVDAAVIHFGRPTAYGNLTIANTATSSYDDAMGQMRRWMEGHVKKTPGLAGWPDDSGGIMRRCRG